MCKFFLHDRIKCPKCVKEAVRSDNNVADKASTTLDKIDDGFTKVKNRKAKGKKVGVQMPQKKPFRGIDVGKGAKFSPSKPKQVYVAVSKKPNATKKKIANEASTSGTNIATSNPFDALCWELYLTVGTV